MYNEFHLRFKLKKDVPMQVISTLQWLMGEDIAPQAENNDHSFFDLVKNLSSWANVRVFCHNESYVDYNVWVERWEVVIVSATRNFQEIRDFVDWIAPFIERYNDDFFLGWFRFEANVFPLCIYIDQEGEIKYLVHTYNDLRD